MGLDLLTEHSKNVQKNKFSSDSADGDRDGPWNIGDF
jgi:hypothetical protein